jgi:protein associated with RNAse G/E
MKEVIMEQVVGSKLSVHCYKHNGKIHRTWDEVTVLDETNDYMVCGNNRVKITESDERSHRTRETAIVFFYKKRWFHVTAQFKNNGLYYKADIASPFLIDDKIIKYIDYDLDVKVFPDGSFRILDRNEYKNHKKIMRYSENLDLILQNELAELINMVRTKVGPFSKELVNNYYQKFTEMQKK